MTSARRSKLIVLFLFLTVTWILAPITQAEAIHREFEFSEVPHLISLTGIFYPLGKNGVRGWDAFTIYIQGKEWWIFDVKKARDISGMELGMVLLEELFPSTLRLVGLKNLIASLENPDMAGKLVTVQGYLLVAYNMLEVTAVNDNS
jgi:hypothetical protein